MDTPNLAVDTASTTLTTPTTPTGSSATPSPSSSKRSRRTVAFYPNMNSSNKPLKPFSRSAAKRESVMALGSIEHLQHYFTKSGLAAEKDPLNKPNSGMRPAIGGLDTLVSRKRAPSLRGFELPPSPAIPEIVQPAFSPHHKTVEIDFESLRPLVIEDLAAVEETWAINGKEPKDSLHVDDGSKPNGDHVDVLDMLKTTTHAIRTVRNYILSLPDETVSPLKPQFRPRTTPSMPPPKRHVSQPNSASDPLSRIRRSALEVLIVLRALEESSRLPLTDDAYDAQSDHGGESSDHLSASGSGSTSGSGGISRGPSPDFMDADMDTSISFVQVGGGLKSVPVWDDDSVDDLNHAEEETKERWEDKLVLGGGWLYKQDISRADLEKEKEVVSRYLDVVDEVLFGGTASGKRGWEREREKEAQKAKSRRASSGGERSPERNTRANRRVVSAGMLDAFQSMVVTEEPEEEEILEEETESVDDDDLPTWAKRSAFEEDPTLKLRLCKGRAHALLQHLLPTSLLPLLPNSPSDRKEFLLSLASGQLLCTAYNVGVRRSRKPWGYVSKDSIHDIAALESQTHDPNASQEQKDKARKGWTFRRTDNLRLWTAALKLRYMIPIVTSGNNAGSGRSQSGSAKGTPVPSPAASLQRFPTTEPPVLFDAPLVARQDPGWEEMLETVVLKWVDAVVDEKRGER
ncbi:hypothetical protein K474DRAFT_1594936 [Panus rudis PR-1116 ss-1]|nr:hypothetical protein K474DRAFT_1594936 [Panus rudis PR-1116 ss-1]